MAGPQAREGTTELAGGPLLSAEVADAAQLLAYSFPEADDIAEKTRQWDRERTYALRDDDGLVSVVLWRLSEVIDCGLRIPICIAGPGATAPRARGDRKLARSQTAFLEMLRSGGCVLSGLETPLPKWHQGNGWGVCSHVSRFVGSPTDLKPLLTPTPGAQFLTEPVDEFLDGVYRAAADTRFGFLVRSSEDWAALRRPTSGDLRRDTIGCRAANGSQGYAVIAHQLDHVTKQLGIEVVELLHSGPEAFTVLLSYLAGHNNVTRLRWDAPPETQLWSMTAQARSWEPQACLDKMVRVVDLAALTLPSWNPPDSLPVLLDVVDVQAPWNAGLWTAVTEDDRIHFERTTSNHASGAVRVQTSGLAPLLLGGAGPDWLADAGLLTAPSSAALDRLRRLTLRPRAPYCPGAW